MTTPRKRPDLEGRARAKSAETGLPFVPRDDLSFSSLAEKYGAPVAFVVSDEGDFLLTAGGKLFFHENTAGLRLKGKKPDALVRIMDVRPDDRIVDCTLGIGCDALVVAAALGDGGALVGVEVSAALEALVRDGLRAHVFSTPRLAAAATRITTVRADHRDFLRRCGAKSFDVVYFDPMFSETVAASPAIRRLRTFAENAPLSGEAVELARRAARRAVVVKGRRGCFDRLRFDEIVTSGGSVFYGAIRV
ncbi:MAG: class I SAM-dependent methyltransferase [bacterium]